VGSTEFVEVTLDDSDGQFTEFIGLVDSIALIQLQTREDFLLGIIGQAHFTDDRIYVLDIAHAIERPLIVYDRSGTPLFRVGSRGRGPGEYLDIAGLEVTEEYIIVHDGAMSSVLVYDLNGVFKYSWELERFPWDIAKLDDQTLVEHDGAGTLTFTDLKGKALHSHSVDTKGIIEIRTAFSRQDDNLNFIDPINQRVWRVTADSLIPYRHIDLGKWQIPPDYYDRFQGKPPVNLHMNVQQRTGFDTDYGLFASFMENSMWDFYVFSMRMLPFNYLFRNKATGKKNFVKFGTGGEGDYDEGFKTLGIGSVMGSLGDMFVMTVSPSDLLEFRDDDRVADPMLLRLQERVKKMEIREDDNNLLLLYRVKDPL
jgi:hypothetical protein